MRKLYFAPAFMFLALFGLSCSSTHMQSTWRDSEYQGTFAKILVLGVSEEEANRRMYENELVAQLKDKGTDAVPSYSILPANIELNKETIAPAIAGSGIDAVLVTRLLKVDEKVHRTRGETYVVPQVYYNHLYGFYGRVYREVHTPGYITKEIIVHLETSLYDVKSEGLVWTALSETLDPQSAAEVIQSLGKSVTTRLVKEGLIAP